MRVWIRIGSLWIVLLAAATASPAHPQGAPATSDGHQRMVDTLARLAETLGPDSPFLSTGKLEELRAAAAQAQPEADPQAFFELNYELGLQEFTRGDLQAAVRSLLTALSMLPTDGGAQADGFRSHLAYYLGLAHLRLGERANCRENHSAQSCIFPIRPGGVHADQAGAAGAVAFFREAFERTPEKSVEHVAAQWLLNIAYMTLGVWPGGVPEAERIPAELLASDAPFPTFTDVAHEAGVATFNLAGGAAMDDFDGDLDLDLVTSTWEPTGQLRFFENVGGSRFEERTEAAGLTGITGGLNLIHADYDDDGDLDVYVLRGGWLREAGRLPNSLLANDGTGRFRDVTFAAGLAEPFCPTQTGAWADFDLDGDLDLYVGNESHIDGFCPSQLFVNQGDGTFVDRAAEAGVTNDLFAKGVAWGDFDGDRRPDLYVSNYQSRNRLYRNRGDGAFEDVAEALGVGLPIESFPVWFWDYDNDGALDLFVTSYPGDAARGPSRTGGGPGRLFLVAARYMDIATVAETPKLYRGDGEGGFAEVSEEAGLAEVSMPMGANWGDLDNDGYPDFYLGTGYPAYDGVMPNVLYWNQRGGGFADVTSASGTGHLQKGHGVVFADFDDDGDQDLFEQLGGFNPDDGYADVLFQNPGFGNHWLKVRLVGRQSNSHGLGATIRVDIEEDGVARSVHRVVGSGGSFGANPFTQHLGLGGAERVKRLTVYWPASDTTQTFDDLAADRLIRVTEGESSFETLSPPGP